MARNYRYPERLPILDEIWTRGVEYHELVLRSLAKAMDVHESRMGGSRHCGKSLSIGRELIPNALVLVGTTLQRLAAYFVSWVLAMGPYAHPASGPISGMGEHA